MGAQSATPRRVKIPALIPAVLLPALAFAQSRPAASAWDFSSENDNYGQWGDRYYTNGVRLAYVSGNQFEPGEDADSLRWFAGAAQELYAPKDRYSANPPADDRPYAGWLHATAGVAWADDDSLDLFTVNAGVVGPSALGEQTQGAWHRLLGVKRLNGWDTQLRDEPGVGAAWLRVWRFRVAGDGKGWGADILPRVGAEGGTVRDLARAGAQFRFGENLPGDFGELRMREGLSGAAPVRYERREFEFWIPDAWYVFVDAGVEARAFDMTLDGNIWHDSRSVERDVFVGQFSAGIAAHWGAARVAFTQIVRTREFRGQRDDPFTFGALTVTVSR